MFYLKFRVYLISLMVLTFCFSQAKAQDYHYEENKGQWDRKVKFSAEIEGGKIYYESNAFHYQFAEFPDHHHEFEETEEHGVKKHHLKAQFIGAKSNPKIEPINASSTYYNYFIGNNRESWASYVRKYNQVYYRALYEGIDLKLYGQEGFLKYDFILSPGADYRQIKIQYRGVKKPRIDKQSGNLIVEHSLGEILEGKPYVYQIVDGKKVEIESAYQLAKGNLIQFEISGQVDPKKPLIIDPTLIFSTYSGSRANNFGMTATYDKFGNTYTAGTVFGNGYDTTLGAFETSFQGGTIDIAISKFNSTGTQMIYGTYLGGNRNETSNSLVVDDSLNLFVFGTTASTNFPLGPNAYDSSKENSGTVTTEISTFVGGTDIYITKLDQDGAAIKGSTYYGGIGADGINNSSTGSYDDLKYNYGDAHRGEIIVDSLGYCYVGTCTRSSNLFDALNSHNGLLDGLVMKFSPNLDSLIWSRYLGGNQYDAIYSLKILNSGQILVGGGTSSFTDFPTSSGSYADAAFGGRSDGFISILSANGQNVLKSTFIGTNTSDQVYFIEYDRLDHIYAFGQTESSNFPLKMTTKADTGAGQFFVKLDPNLDSLELSTTFGVVTPSTNVNISPTAFLVDRCFNMYASGWGGDIAGGELDKNLNNNMYTSPGAFQSTTDGNDFYLYVLNGNADSVLYATFYGGNQSDDHVDGGTSRFDKDGIIYQSVCASCFTSSNDFPTTPNAYSRTKGSITNHCNNAVFKYDFEILPIANFISDSTEFCLGNNDTVAITLTDLSVRADKITWDFYGTLVQSNFSDTTIYITQAGNYSISQLVEDTVCATGDITSILIRARPDNLILDLPQDTLVCFRDSFKIDAIAANQNELTWASDPDFNTVLQAGNSKQYELVLQNGVNTIYLKATNSLTDACEKTDSIIITYSPISYSANLSEDTICENTSVTAMANLNNIDAFRWNFDNGVLDTVNLTRTVNYSAPGNYTLSLIVENNLCKAKDTTLIPLNVVQNNLNYSPLADTTYCGLDILDYSINSFGTASSFLWSNSSSFSDTINAFPFDSSFIVSSNQNHNYYFKIEDQYCERFDEVYIHYIEYEARLDDIIDSICTPASIPLNSTQKGVDQFTFNFGDGSINTSQEDPVKVYTDSGTYIIQLVTENNTCMRSDTLRDTLRVERSVDLEPINDTLICLGDTVGLSMNSMGTAIRYFWATDPLFLQLLNTSSDSSVLISPSANGIYYYKASNAFCDADSSLNINVQDLDVIVDDFISICEGDTVNIMATDLNSINPSYIWQPRDSIIGSNLLNTVYVAPKNDLKITLNSTSSIGCTDLDSSFIEVNAPAFTDAFVSSLLDTVYKGQSIQLSTNRTGANLSYVWSPAQSLNDPFSPTPIASPLSTTVYSVTITDNSTSCEVISFKRISVFEINCNEPEIFVPSAFTPNQDGQNDVLFVRGALVQEIDFQVFNRWGEKVFESQSLSKGWDGTYKGKEADPGVFVFHLKARCFDGQTYTTQGNVTLIR